MSRSPEERSSRILGVFLICAAFAANCASSAETPARVCDPRRYGARADGVTKDTAAIQSAIDACAAEGGGTVRLSAGVFLSGMLTLRSSITLRIEPSATLKGSRDDADYPDTHPNTDNGQLSNCNKTLLYADGATDLTLEGGGTIDGSGDNPRWKGKERTRPMAVFIVGSDRVTIQNLKIKDAGMWGVVNMETDHLTIRKLDVNTPYGPTRDGIDVVDCHHVLIEDSVVLSEDDAICLKSGSRRGVFDVTVRNCHVARSSVANALKLGTASVGSFKKVLFENIVIDGADKAAMAVESVDGAVVDDVRFQNIQFRDAGTAVFVLLGWRGGKKPAVGGIKNVFFNDVKGETKHTWGSAISGTSLDGVTHRPHDIVFENVSVVSRGGLKAIPAAPPEYAGQYPDPNLWGNLPAFGYYIRHAAGVTFKDSTVSADPADARPPIVRED